MKLSKKVVIIFTIFTIMTIIMYTLSAKVILNNVYKDNKEATRISGISGGVINRTEGEVKKLIGQASEYAALLRGARMLNGMYEEIDEKNIDKAFGLEERLKEDGIEFKFTIEGPLENFAYENTLVFGNENVEERNKIVKEIQQLVKKNYDEKKGKKTVNGLIEVEGRYYSVATSALVDGRDGTIRAYLCIANNFDDDFLGLIEEGMGREKDSLALVDDLTGVNFIEDEEEKYKTSKGAKLDITYDNKYITSYYKMPVLNTGNDVYLTLKQEFVIRNSMENITNKLTYILAGIIVIFNIIICIIIERVVVKRIVKINDGVNNIRESKRLSDRIEVQEGNDEISRLSKDINYMINSLEDSNKLIFEKDKKYGTLLNTLTNGYLYFKIMKNEDGSYKDAVCIELNDATMDILRVSKKDIQYKSISNILSIFKGDAVSLEKLLKSNIDSGVLYTNDEVEIKNGVWVSIGIYLIEDGYFACIITDITNTKKYSEDMKYLANYDVVTTLLNRYSLYNYMDRLIYDEKPFTVYFIDLDNFKNLNDTLGHSTGDEVLCGAASALLSIESDTLTVGRLGGDEFIVIREGNLNDKEVYDLGKEILKALNQTFRYKNFTYELKGSIGASSYPKHASDIETVLQYADIAMYRSKKSGGNRLNIISEDMLEDIIIEAQLKEALINKEFKVYYQPIFNLEEHKIVGAEALIRWYRDGEIIPPDKFIPIAKRTGDIIDIDNFVLREACDFCKKWREDGALDFQVSINASHLFLKQENLKKDIKKLLKENKLEPSALKLEITEDEILDDPKYIITILKDIKKIGVKVSLDDFGIGYSSFNHIKMLPIDTIKIDRSLLLKVEEDKKSLAIIETLINLSHTLELDVVCEGVEEIEQLNLLKGLNCDKIQGYFISRPVIEEEFDKVMEKY